MSSSFAFVKKQLTNISRSGNWWERIKWNSINFKSLNVSRTSKQTMSMSTYCLRYHQSVCFLLLQSFLHQIFLPSSLPPWHLLFDHNSHATDLIPKHPGKFPEIDVLCYVTFWSDNVFQSCNEDSSKILWKGRWYWFYDFVATFRVNDRPIYIVVLLIYFTVGCLILDPGLV